MSIFWLRPFTAGGNKASNGLPPPPPAFRPLVLNPSACASSPQPKVPASGPDRPRLCFLPQSPDLGSPQAISPHSRAPLNRDVQGLQHIRYSMLFSRKGAQTFFDSSFYIPQTRWLHHQTNFLLQKKEY